MSFLNKSQRKPEQNQSTDIMPSEDEVKDGAAPEYRAFQPSMYSGLDVDTIVAKHINNVSKIRKYAMGGIIVLGVIVLLILLRGDIMMSAIALIAYVVAARSTLTNQHRSLTQLWNSISTILTMDVDPAKYLKVLDALRDQQVVMGRGKAAAEVKEGLLLWESICHALGGHPQEALQDIESYDAGNPTGNARERSHAYNQLCVKLLAAASLGEKNMMDAVVEAIKKLDSKMVQHDPLCKPVELLYAEAKVQQAVLAHNTEEGLELVEDALGRVVTKQQYVGCIYARACMFDELGDVEQAMSDYEYVSREGGTLEMQEKAAVRLKELEAHPAGEDVAVAGDAAALDADGAADAPAPGASTPEDQQQPVPEQ
ncbi:MAG: hypothetical protein ACOX4F_09220 [Atopobiaceae bacterium]|jgi:hypothetical protein